MVMSIFFGFGTLSNPQMSEYFRLTQKRLRWDQWKQWQKVARQYTAAAVAEPN